mgnify:CR=1 FL=1
MKYIDHELVLITISWKAIKRNFQGQFGNEMLLEFRISLLLPPPIKFRSDTKCKENAQYPGNVYNIAQLLPNFKNAFDRAACFANLVPRVLLRTKVS